MRQIVIIGNGIAGITAARHLRKLSNFQITVISSESKYFFSRTALMYVYMGHMTFEQTQPYESWFWEKNNIVLKQTRVIKLNHHTKQLTLSDGTSLGYDDLIIATGSKPKLFDWPGQNAKGVQSLYSKQDLELLYSNAPNRKVCKKAVVVGGGLIGIELAEMLHSREIPVTLLVRENSYWGNVLTENEGTLVSRHITSKGIDLRLSTGLKEIKTNAEGRVSHIVSSTDEKISCDLVGLTTGVKPNIDFLRDSGLELDKGILVNEFLETNLPNIYAIGDCAQQKVIMTNRVSIEPVWYTARKMGEIVARTIATTKTAYSPGVWFNSAKFFDIEYQTYGSVHPFPKADESHLYWEDTRGRRSITIAYHQSSNAILGITAFGIRLKHLVLDQWISSAKDINFVIDHLREINFDPEFYPKHLKSASMMLKKQLQTP